MRHSLGAAAFDRLQPAMRRFHGFQGGAVEGVFQVNRGPGLPLRALHFLGRLPPPTTTSSTSLHPSSSASPSSSCSPPPPLPYCRVTVTNDGGSQGGEESRLFFHPEAPTDERRAHRFVSRFGWDGQHGFYENVLGGLIRFQFHHTAASASELISGVTPEDRQLCERLYYEALPKHLRGGEEEGNRRSSPSSSSCLALSDSNVLGWRGRSSAVRALFGAVPLPGPWLTCGMEVRDVNIPHRDGRGWFVQVHLQSSFGLLTSYVGHVRVVR